MAISTPAYSQINHVATALEYKSKKAFINTGAQAGSALTQATVLVYDDILRFQTGPNKYFTADELATFKYDNFEGNVIWFMDELVGMESDWRRDAAAADTSGNVNQTAYGYVQFTNATVETAVNRYINHIERFNERSATRSIHYYGISKGSKIRIPYWVSRIKASIDAGTYNHKFEIDRMTYDELTALAFVHLHRKTSKDSNFRLLSFGDVIAAKELYENNHHTNAKTATLNRLDRISQPGLDADGKTIPGTDPGFFRIHYVPAPTLMKFAQGLPTAEALTLLYNITVEQIFTTKYKAKVAEVRAANDLTSDD